MSKKLLQVASVSRRFKSTLAVDNLSLQINEGEYVALLGPNGAGKTTLVEMIEGVQKPDNGQITIDGLNWKQHEKKLRHLIGLSLQETRFIDKITVLETLHLFAGFYGLEKERALEVMQVVNLKPKQDTYTMNLSGGQKQRLALAIAILNKPRLLLLDEPTTGLDPHARREIWYVLEKMREQNNTTLILTTHYMEEAEYLCERIVIMHQGRILADGTMQQLMAGYETTEIIELEVAESYDENRLKNMPGVSETTIEGNSITLAVKNAAALLPDLMSRVPGKDLVSLQVRRLTLDDLFLKMSGVSLNE